MSWKCHRQTDLTLMCNIDLHLSAWWLPETLAVFVGCHTRHVFKSIDALQVCQHPHVKNVSVGFFQTTAISFLTVKMSLSALLQK